MCDPEMKQNIGKLSRKLRRSANRDMRRAPVIPRCIVDFLEDIRDQLLFPYGEEHLEQSLLRFIDTFKPTKLLWMTTAKVWRDMLRSAYNELIGGVTPLSSYNL